MMYLLPGDRRHCLSSQASTTNTLSSKMSYQPVLPSKSTTKYQKYHLPKISSTTNTLSSKMSYKPSPRILVNYNHHAWFIIHYHALFTKLNDVLNISCWECDWNDSFMHKTFVSFQPICKFATHLLHIFVWLKWFSRTFMHKTFVSSRDKLQTESNWLAWSRFKSVNKNVVFIFKAIFFNKNQLCVTWLRLKSKFFNKNTVFSRQFV